MDKGADISECGKYRYRLWRWWDGSKSLCGFLMLNPSTADADIDDPTIRKCCGFAKKLGYGGIMVTNLFAFRATDPSELKTASDPIGPDNDVYVTTEAKTCDITICAWGTKGVLHGRDKAVLKMLAPHNIAHLYCLKLTKEDHPMHPLYIPYDTKPMLMPTGERVCVDCGDPLEEHRVSECRDCHVRNAAIGRKEGG